MTATVDVGHATVGLSAPVLELGAPLVQIAVAGLETWLVGTFFDGCRQIPVDVVIFILRRSRQILFVIFLNHGERSDFLGFCVFLTDFNPLNPKDNPDKRDLANEHDNHNVFV